MQVPSAEQPALHLSLRPQHKRYGAGGCLLVSPPNLFVFLFSFFLFCKWELVGVSAHFCWFYSNANGLYTLFCITPARPPAGVLERTPLSPGAPHCPTPPRGRTPVYLTRVLWTACGPLRGLLSASQERAGSQWNVVSGEWLGRFTFLNHHFGCRAGTEGGGAGE